MPAPVFHPIRVRLPTGQVWEVRRPTEEETSAFSFAWSAMSRPDDFGRDWNWRSLRSRSQHCFAAFDEVGGLHAMYAGYSVGRDGELRFNLEWFGTAPDRSSWPTWLPKRRRAIGRLSMAVAAVAFRSWGVRVVELEVPGVRRAFYEALGATSGRSSPLDPDCVCLEFSADALESMAVGLESVDEEQGR